MSSTSTAVEVYQFRLNLRGISPMIWRQVLVRSDKTLADLHYITQITLNWSNYYLHRFTIRGKSYAVPRLHQVEAHNAREITLQQLKLRLNERFLYEYSFFDWWTHEFRFEKRLPLIEGKVYPVCIAGARTAPPEDCGGAEDFMEQQAHFSPFFIEDELLNMLRRFQEEDGPNEDEREDYRHLLRSFQYWMTVEKFDRRDVNQRLKWYAVGDERWAEHLEVL